MAEEVVAVQNGLRDAGRGIFESFFIIGEEQRLIESTRNKKRGSGAQEDLCLCLDEVQ
jgi:hypothetical protein